MTDHEILIELLRAYRHQHDLAMLPWHTSYCRCDLCIDTDKAVGEEREPLPDKKYWPKGSWK